MYNSDRLVAKLKEHQLDAIVSSTKENTFYLSGFMPVVRTLNPYHGICLVVVLADSPNEIHVVHSHGESDQILDADVEVGECEFYGTFYRETGDANDFTLEEKTLREISCKSPMGRTAVLATQRLFENLGLEQAALGFDIDGVPREFFEQITACFPNCSIENGSEILRDIRRVKTSEEVQLIQLAAQSAEEAIQAAVSSIGPNSTEADVASSFERALINEGARPALTMIKAGRHAVGGQRRQRKDICIKDTGLIWFDCDTIQNYYWADIARVFVIGDDRIYREKFDALYAGQRYAIEHIRPGMTGNDIFELTMSCVHRAGFPEYRRHHVGHGIGLEPYERPILSPGSKDVVECGMTLSIETPYYEYGLGALHVEDPIHIGDAANTILTKTSGTMSVL
ncbi:Xaa-Pro peptidase family protein [Sphingorhabdus sp. EL138]|uniref:M24 family metallopeptidase n=1 Tax=Sphingorhabdus sp. EL138 TaxID=2073156 RepID=UPI000D69FF16|nr:Xaa-Pro peptidase family protein [Sphingorhabdus sp. EL138]